MATAPAPYPRRLIEVDLPIRQISEHARREKSIRHGHISTLHLWWARRPLAACRAVILASLWPDPADPLCPEVFREAARRELRTLRDKRGGHPYDWDDNLQLRRALLAFIADFANWDRSNDADYLAASRALVQVAHEALGGEPGTRPLVVDPFAGGGAIPLEALRVGADAFASDLNPVAVLLNKVVLEYVPKYGQRLADEVRKWGAWVKDQAEKDLSEFYPKDPDGGTPIAYLWARTIKCEGPSCGAEIPLLRTLRLATKANRVTALKLTPDTRRKYVFISILESVSHGADTSGTIRGGVATCPVCGFSTSNARVRDQLAQRHGGSSDSRLLAVQACRASDGSRYFRPAIESDLVVLTRVAERLREPSLQSIIPLDLIPPERPSPNARGVSAVTRMGIRRFSDLFTPRQLLALTTFVRLVDDLGVRDQVAIEDEGLRRAVRSVLACGLGRMVDRCSTLCTWDPSPTASGIIHVFSRQALPIVWDFAEGSPFESKSGGWIAALEWSRLVVEREAASLTHPGQAYQASATRHPLGDDVASATITDPPYFDAVPYADLSDYFYTWLRHCFRSQDDSGFSHTLTPKDEEAIWNPGRVHSTLGVVKDEKFYLAQMTHALRESRRVTTPCGVGVVVFAHKSAEGWEAMLSALLEAGWIATASWPIDTERANRTNAIGTASLASSVHIVCRPRENLDGSLRTDIVGDWNDVLDELPTRIAAWLPRLASEGVVGADAIFACLGPALEIFSRYSRVEKASGDVVPLREYLERVWAEVARQALSMIFAGADTSGFEHDARLTAMWLWTLSTNKGAVDEADDEATIDEEDAKPSGKSKGGFGLEYDAARKIAQGLGASLETLTTLVEVKGDAARLLGVGEREATLFPKKGAAKVEAPAAKRAKKAQLALALGDTEPTADAKKADVVAEPEELGAPTAGGTMLDQVHQAMLMFRGGRSAAMKRFLVEDGVGREERFWKLAQSLSALYPTGTEEKRWVDGVLARKKGLGL